MAGFRSQWVAGFMLECLAGFVGIRMRRSLKLIEQSQIMLRGLEIQRPTRGESGSSTAGNVFAS
jgi:hypothetical protein